MVISIIGILIALSIFGLQGARTSSRDAKRKADLEQIRSGLEIYKADCNKYPLTADFSLPNATVLKGSGSPASCSLSNNYISSVPQDPVPGRNYSYKSDDGLTYFLCASLEQGSSSSVEGCGSCGASQCNLQVANP